MARSRPRRRTSISALMLAAVTIPTAVITLLGIAPLDVLPFNLSGIGQGIVQIATVVGAVAVLIGILNLLMVHLRNTFRMSSVSALYSGITLLAFFAVVILHILEARGILKLGTPPPSGEPMVTLTLMDVLQVVIESALSGLLFFFLVYSAYRLMRRRITVSGVIFIVALVVVLIGYVQPPGSALYSLREWLLRVPVSAGTRGLLIGIAIGTITVGVRVLVGQDRLFSE